MPSTKIIISSTKTHIYILGSVCLKKDVSVKDGEDINEEMLDDTNGAKDNKEQKMVDTISDLALSLFTYEVTLINFINLTRFIH